MLEIFNTILTGIGYVILASLGMAVHFVKEKTVGGKDLPWLAFFYNNRDRTILALLVSITGVYVFMEAGQITGTAAIGLGYTFDSWLNKWSSKLEENK
jgi:hypothetical protein